MIRGSERLGGEPRLEKRDYRDSLGRTRVERPLIRGENPPMVILIDDPVSCVQYTLDPQAKIAHRFAYPKPRAEEGNAPRSAFVGAPSTRGPKVESEALGTKNLEGVLVEGRRTVTTFPKGAISQGEAVTQTEESWVSPELHLNVVQKVFDSRQWEVTLRYVNLRRAEPDLRQFSPPLDYAIVEETGRFTVPY